MEDDRQEQTPSEEAPAIQSLKERIQGEIDRLQPTLAAEGRAAEARAAKEGPVSLGEILQHLNNQQPGAAASHANKAFLLLLNLVEAIGEPAGVTVGDPPAGVCNTIEDLRRHPAFIAAWQYLHP
ncbi:MAG TPA: hypothetical protein VI756_15420 [Blastocatellia bacterium]